MIHGSSEELFDCQKTDPLLKNSFIVKNVCTSCLKTQFTLASMLINV